jgi:RNA polymerase sigma-70 factor (family 1)
MDMFSASLHTDEQVIDAFRRGEEQAFDQLYRRFSSRLVLFSYKILDNRQDAEDVVQECFMRLWTQRKTLASIDAVKSYLYTAVKNASLNFKRKKSTQAKREETLKQQKKGDELNAEQLIVMSETMQQIYDRIAELPARMQEVFKLYYIEGKSYKEIGQLLNTDPETVRNQRGKALRVIRNSFHLFWAMVY